MREDDEDNKLKNAVTNTLRLATQKGFKSITDVYKEEYNSIIEEIKLLLDELANEEEMIDFLKIMES